MTELYEFHIPSGEVRGPYYPVACPGPAGMFCMVHKGQTEPHPAVLISGRGALEHMDDLRRVAWASERSLRAGLDARGVGWLPVLPY